MHKNWRKTNLLESMVAQTQKRSLKDLTIGPVLSWNNQKIKKHVDDILALDGAKILVGGTPLIEKHSIPEIYGSW